MITKSYSIMCDDCTKSEGLFGRNLKECQDEAERMGWTKKNGKWICEECNQKSE